MEPQVTPRRSRPGPARIHPPILLYLAIAASPALPETAEPVDPGLRLPAGFEVTLYAGDDLAHDIYSLAMDAKGRVVVAGAGYVKVLHDRDGDGAADEATLFSDRPRSGSHGMVFIGDDLLASGDEGLHRIPDRDGDGVADGPGKRWLPSANDGEHAANGIVQGPDGWLYWICGNDAGIDSRHVRCPGSPVRRPICGAVVRVSPDGSRSEVIAHGFRNPYDLAFNSTGALFTYDADGERDQYLPWYSPTRIFDIAQGLEHGWVLKGWQHAWNRPATHFDSVERLWEVGRGSPTGVVVYRHRSFPARYHDGLFAACWSLGRIYFFPLRRRGATWQTSMEIFLNPAGDEGFAPVGLEVGPAGELFVAIGGRGTRGSVYRIVYRGPRGPWTPPPTPLAAVLRADQPLSSWSREAWVPRAREIGRSSFESAALDPSLPTRERLRAIEILVELFGGLDAAIARKLLENDDAEVSARAVWAVSRSPDSTPRREALVSATASEDPPVARAAWEALGALPSSLDPSGPAPAWLAGLRDRDRRIRAATMIAGRGPGRESFDHVVPDPDALEHPRHLVGYLAIHAPARGAPPEAIEVHVERSLHALEATNDPRIRLDALRLIQIGLGDVELVQDRPSTADGYAASEVARLGLDRRREAVARLAPIFPTGHPELDGELGRTIAMLAAGHEDILERFATLWTEGSRVENDIHYLLCAARVPAERSGAFSRACARALLDLSPKMARVGNTPSRYWPARVQRVFTDLRARDPDLVPSMLTNPAFGRPEHSLFAAALEGNERLEAVRVLLRKATDEVSAREFTWTPELVALVGELPAPEGRPALRERWNERSLRDAIALVLATTPVAQDRERLVEALDSRQAAVVTRVARALASLEAPASPEEIRSALGALRVQCSLGEEDAARTALVDLLRRWTGQELEITEEADPHALYAIWLGWFREAHADDAEGLPDAGAGEDIAAQLERLERIAWEQGDAERGRAFFAERACQTCHLGSRRLGPELDGITSRLSRRDVFLAIVDPSRDISPSYASKEVITRSGAVYSGTMIYQSPAAILLQTSPDTTVRLTGKDVREIRTSRISFMPSGLLLDATDRELADLHAFLKTLGK